MKQLKTVFNSLSQAVSVTSWNITKLFVTIMFSGLMIAGIIVGSMAMINHIASNTFPTQETTEILYILPSQDYSIAVSESSEPEFMIHIQWVITGYELKDVQIVGKEEGYAFYSWLSNRKETQSPPKN